jgi:hypothetical protein
MGLYKSSKVNVQEMKRAARLTTTVSSWPNYNSVRKVAKVRDLPSYVIPEFQATDAHAIVFGTK